MFAFMAIVLVSVGAPEIWVESPLVRVFPESFPLAESAREARLRAACGERESIQLCIRAKGKPLEAVSIEGHPIGKHIPPPDVYRTGYLRIEQPSPRAEREGTLWPDPLLECNTFSLEADSTAAIRLIYGVPRDAVPGTYSGKVSVHFGKRGKRTIPISFEIFPFLLPETPSLRTAFPLDRKSIRDVYGIADTDLEAWKPFYDALSRERIAYRVWDGGPLVTIDREGNADTSRLKEHIAYAVDSAHFNAIDIGAGQAGIAPFPAPKPGKLQDPLQFYLHDMCNWLDDRGQLPLAYIEVMPLPERAYWQAAREAYFRVHRNDKRVARLLAGAGDPFFERYTDIWATPLGSFDPYCDALLRQGRSLTITQNAPAEAVSARSSGSFPGETSRESRPEDAYDGCLFTYWVSRGIPMPDEPQWLQINLREPVTVRTIRIIWKNGLEAKELDVERWIGSHFSRFSRIRWTPHPPPSLFTQSSLEGTFDEAETFQSIRFEFRASFFHRVVGVTEIVFGDMDTLEPAASIAPIATWLCESVNDFPSFAVDARPVEARLFPWVCWGHQAEGFVARRLNRWPPAWVNESVAQPLVWRCRDAGLGFLFYPGRNGLLPSVRSEALRDGMEDFEYLVMLDQAVKMGRVSARDAGTLCMRRLFSANVPPQQVDELARIVEYDRVRIGWALTKAGKDQRP
ncbi:MAG TPA: DUF4091 domain-containing protein [Candidatus Hydrogenedentes bacterium]|nr:DUF4091 domain-containing protein [Candidatus Hydrogenedentota bacterium]